MASIQLVSRKARGGKLGSEQPVQEVGARAAEGWTRSTSCSCECTERGCSSRRGRASSWATGGPKGSPEAHQGWSGARVSPKRRVLEGQVACLPPLKLLSQQLQNSLSWDKVKRSQYGDFNPCFLFSLQFAIWPCVSVFDGS